MSDVAPEGTTDVTGWLRRRQNTRTHVLIGITGIFIGLIGCSLPVWVSFLTGLYISPTIYPAWLGTFDYLSTVFVGLWSVTLIRLGIWDEDHYQYRLANRIRRSKRSDILIPITYVVTAVLWGELLLRPILTARTNDPKIVAHQRGGIPALEAGILDVMIAYYAVLAVVFAIYLIGLRHNPVDLDVYDQLARRILRSRRTSNRS